LGTGSEILKLQDDADQIFFLSLLLLGSVTHFGQVKSAIDLPSKPHQYDAYLFAYFEGSGDKLKQEQLRFGISTNGTQWYALNQNEPIISSATISATGGIRDPHILRASDDRSFYLTATDMFTQKTDGKPIPA